MIGQDVEWDSTDTSLMLTLNNLAKEYGLLPSEALSRATTFDLYVLDLSARYFRHKQDQADGKVSKLDKTYSTDQLQKMFDEAKTFNKE